MSIEVKGLTHIYSEGLPHESVALEDVNFKAEDGQLVGIIGHTGSGKSTLAVSYTHLQFLYLSEVFLLSDLYQRRLQMLLQIPGL